MATAAPNPMTKARVEAAAANERPVTSITARARNGNSG